MNLVHSPNQQQRATAHDFNPIVYHYVKKSNIERSKALGASSPALCGERNVYFNPIAGRPVDAKQGRTVCPLCQLVYDTLPAKKVASNG